MAAASERKAWLWKPAGGPGSDPTHPAETPTDEAASTKRWERNLRGPRLARIIPVSVLTEKKGKHKNHVFVLDKQNQQEIEVQTGYVLHEREGLLLIQELMRIASSGGSLSAAWLSKDLCEALEKQAGGAGKLLGSSSYVQKILIRKAVTGAKYVDNTGTEHSYRRDLNEEDGEIPPGQEKDGYFCIKELVDYMPPWEAFCNDKCGFYQDFYKVRWADPYSKADYSNAENGCPDPGCTWEPDENLPPCLDTLRVKRKRDWFQAQTEKEAQAESERKRLKVEAAEEEEQRKRLSEEKKKQEMERANTAKARRKRDFTPLDGDLVSFYLGHDFFPQKSDKFPNVRLGWPRAQNQYPLGFGAATPPGFCWEKCDCMDDQRGQKEWEVTKAWIPPHRSQSATGALNHFAGQSTFVRRRGQVSGTHYFETETGIQAGSIGQRAAADLSVTIQGAIRQAFETFPASALSSASDSVHVPSRAIISIRENGDYLPLSIEGKMDGGNPLPKWLQLEPDTGLLRIDPEHRPQSDFKVVFSIKMYEGVAKAFLCTMTAGSQAPPHDRVLAPVKQWMSEYGKTLDPGTKRVVSDQLAQLQNCPLGRFLAILSRCQNFLRAASVATLIQP